MRIIAFSSAKGGSGKTTLASAMAVAATRKGEQVAVADLDPQSSLEAWHSLRSESDILLFRLSEPDDLDAIREAAAEHDIGLVILDCPPTVSDLAERAVALADLVILPVKVSPLDMLSIDATIELSRRHGKPVLAVINETPDEAKQHVNEAREALEAEGVTVARTSVSSRYTIREAMKIGRSAQEIKTSRDKSASELGRLWIEIANQLKALDAKPARRKAR